MKATLFDSSGAKKGTIDLPVMFSADIRQDLAQKYLEVEKYELRQPYASYEEAGKRHSASGRVRRIRHKWRTGYGKGMARVPKKTMWRRGTQFYWVSAEVANTRGGRRAHPPKGIYKLRKINSKEIKLAFSAAFAATAQADYIKKRYSSLIEVPASLGVIESLPAKTKELRKIIDQIYPKALETLSQVSVQRSGKGKTRGRRYKTNAGLLILTGEDEKLKFAGLDIKPISEVDMKDLFPLGRLTLYTKKALEELNNDA